MRETEQGSDLGLWGLNQPVQPLHGDVGGWGDVSLEERYLFTQVPRPHQA